MRKRKLSNLSEEALERVFFIETLLKDTQRLRNKTYQKLHRLSNRDFYLKYRRENARHRTKTDVNFRLSSNLRHRLWKGLKNGSHIGDLGCSINELKLHLESKFQPGMSWQNYGRTGWHVDHILPLSKFDLSNRDDFLKACHYSNLQPLWAKDNLLKGNK